MDVLHPLGWIEIQVENLIGSALLAPVFLVYIHLSRDYEYHHLSMLGYCCVRTKTDGGFQFENADIWNVIVCNQNALAQMNSQLGQYK